MESMEEIYQNHSKKVYTFLLKENRCGECCAYLCDKTAAPEGRTLCSGRFSQAVSAR